MLEIQYSRDGLHFDEVATYKNGEAFLAAQYLEVPAFEDYYKISKVTLDGKAISLEDATMGGLFNYLNQK